MKSGKIYIKRRIVLIAAAALVIIIITLLFKGGGVSYDKSIAGEPYSEAELLLPEAPSPSPAPQYINAEQPGHYMAGIEGIKMAYLTFDDGPSSNVTPAILDVLKEKNVHATFFALGSSVEKYPDIAKRVVDEGNVLANHTYSHVYKSLYDDSNYFIEDVQRAERAIAAAVGEDKVTRLFRFPGGSFENYKKPKKELLLQKDYYYIDWNVSSGDAAGRDVPPEALIGNVKNTLGGKNTAVILMHDSSVKATTAEALPAIIDMLKAEGYSFGVLAR